MLATGTQVTKAQSADSAQTAAAVAAYWTPERLASARPRTPLISSAPEASFELQPSVVRTSAGRPPDPRVVPNFQNLLYHPSFASEPSPGSGVAPNNDGVFNAHFTSSRVIPYGAVGIYPFRAAGKLFFSDSVGGNFICSAFVISFRVVATAGHCVYQSDPSDPSPVGYFENFMFVPGFVNGIRPFGTWTAAFVRTTNTWIMGGGEVPNAADYAMMEMNDQVSNPMRIGSVTGFLGWQTANLNPNHVSMFGYPADFDFGLLMHRVDADAFRNMAPNNVEYGSDMTGGSSGGPWVQNFGEPSIGQTGGDNPGLNRVVGVTSYGYTAPANAKVQGASVPDQRWVDLFDLVCAHRVGNCTP
jgi:V8-like Glu-specific endopeptidase